MLAGGGFVDDEGELVLGPHAPHIFHGGTPNEIIVMPVAVAGEKIRVVQE